MKIAMTAPTVVPKVLFTAATTGCAKSMPIIMRRKVITLMEEASFLPMTLHSHMRKITPKTQKKISPRDEKNSAFTRLSIMEVIPPRTEPMIRLIPNFTEFLIVSCIQITDVIQAKLGEVPKRYLPIKETTSFSE